MAKQVNVFKRTIHLQSLHALYISKPGIILTFLSSAFRSMDEERCRRATHGVRRRFPHGIKIDIHVGNKTPNPD